MPTTAPVKNSNFKLVPAGTHIARCVQFIHMGTLDELYQGKPVQHNKIRLTFELPEELHVFKEENGEQPMVISQEYTLSLGEKANLRRLVAGITGKSLTNEEAAVFDVETLVGMPCLLTVQHKRSAAGKDRAEIATAAPLLKGMTAPAQVNPSRYLTFENFDQEFFDRLPDFVKDKIKSSPEYQIMINGGSSLSEEDKSQIRAHREGAQGAQRSAQEITDQDIPF